MVTVSGSKYVLSAVGEMVRIFFWFSTGEFG